MRLCKSRRFFLMRTAVFQQTLHVIVYHLFAFVIQLHYIFVYNMIQMIRYVLL